MYQIVRGEWFRAGAVVKPHFLVAVARLAVVVWWLASSRNFGGVASSLESGAAALALARYLVG